MTAIEVAGDLSRLDAALQEVPNDPAVFLLWPREAAPYLSRTTLLRRRLLRLLKERERPSRLLNLRHTVERIEYRLTASSLESSVVFYELARRNFPQEYADLVKLRLPPWVRILTGNAFPRSQITTQITRNGVQFGPFRSRASAERFEAQFLDLFQMRRCQEDLAPSPDHPGCIYGEMGMCLRPCQQVVGPAEYGNEIVRVIDFLRSDGHSLLDAIVRSRDRLSDEMMFEEAARQHKRMERVQDVLRLRDEMVRDIDALHGVAITRSVSDEAVEMWFIRGGWWCTPQRLDFQVVEGRPVSLDKKVRELLAAVTPLKLTVAERQEYLALFSRWNYSTWRDGEWLPFEGYDAIPYRKIINAVSRVVKR